jgi:hypothetical protein
VPEVEVVVELAEPTPEVVVVEATGAWVVVVGEVPVVVVELPVRLVVLVVLGGAVVVVVVVVVGGTVVVVGSTVVVVVVSGVSLYPAGTAPLGGAGYWMERARVIRKTTASSTVERRIGRVGLTGPRRYPPARLGGREGGVARLSMRRVGAADAVSRSGSSGPPGSLTILLRRHCRP